MNPSVRRSNQIVSDEVDDENDTIDAMMNEIDVPVVVAQMDTRTSTDEVKQQHVEATQTNDYEVVQLDAEETPKRGMKRKLPSWSQPRVYGGLPLTSSHKGSLAAANAQKNSAANEHDGQKRENYVCSSQVLFSIPQSAAGSTGNNNKIFATRGNFEPDPAIDIEEPPAKRARVDAVGSHEDSLIRTSSLGQYMFNCKEMSPLELFSYFEAQRQ